MTAPEKLDRWIGISILLHVGIFAIVIASPIIFPFQGSENWGSSTAGGEGISVSISGGVAGIPLPAPEVVNENAAANESPGFYKSDPAPPPPPTPEEAEPIPEPKAPVKVTKATKAAPSPARPSKAPPVAEPPQNAVPFGEGGRPALGYGQSTQGGPVGAGAFGDAAFGSKYSSYVNAMVRRISQNWLQGLIDRNVSGTPRVYVSFDIARDGTISNVRIVQGSNIPSLDQSARRAVLASNPLPPLPSDYSGSSVSVVSFYFEYVRR